MVRLKTFRVFPKIPNELCELEELSRNLWWTWNPSAQNIFAKIFSSFATRQFANPYSALAALSPAELSALVQNRELPQLVRQLQTLRKNDIHQPSWWKTVSEQLPTLGIAYFSAEFGLHESLPIYSGGLGVLSGDHLKAASELDLPFVAVGLLYGEGYFSQQLNPDGWQMELYPPLEIAHLPIRLALDADGKQVCTTVEIGSELVFVQAWEVQVGSIRLFLLDTNVEQNPVPLRSITSRLYGGDALLRIQQEIVLGIGGSRILHSLGIRPTVHHMNEGHSAFLIFEQLRCLMKDARVDFEVALEIARHGNLFTTHTPVPAGNDAFPRELIEQGFSRFFREYSLPLEPVLGLGRTRPTDSSEAFSMTVLALRGSYSANAVSALHGVVSRRIWQNIWPGLSAEEVPIGHVTNGVHLDSWLSEEMIDLFDSTMGRGWRTPNASVEQFSGFEKVSDEALWNVRQKKREQLVALIRNRYSAQLQRISASLSEAEQARNILDPNALTIGFARRFATYKRATLLLQDMPRLEALLRDNNRPLQFVFAGKSHPADHAGKEFIARLAKFSRQSEANHRFLFLEDYDIHIARAMVQGVDIWLNNPRRPLEASGTSGMKAAANGILNASVLDGWWCEGYNGQNGWAIGRGEEFSDAHYQDEREGRALYDLLEQEILPLFYERDAQNLPRRWLSRVKNCIMTLPAVFSSGRMVAEYTTKFYIPLALSKLEAEKQHYAAEKTIVDARKLLSQHWHELRILSVETAGKENITRGQDLHVQVTVDLGALSPEYVAVQLLLHPTKAQELNVSPQTLNLRDAEPQTEQRVFRYSTALNGAEVGSFGFSVRLVPFVAGQPMTTIPGFMTWWS